MDNEVLPESLTPAEAAFFTELAALMEKYDATLHGCGCCGSPSITVGRTFDKLRVVDSK